MRVNAQRVTKAAVKIAPGDVVTLAQGANIRIVEVVACGLRRGPASEAQGLYIDKTPMDARESAPQTARVGRRPTKKDRRMLDRSRARSLE